MYNRRLVKLQKSLLRPLLVKKKENLLYLTGRVFSHGYLLLLPQVHMDRKTAGSRGRSSVVFFGDGLERPPKIHSDILKNIGMYLGRQRVLQIEDQFTFAEYAYLRAKCRGGHQPPEKRQPLAASTRCRIVPGRSLVDYQRMIKEPGEIALIRKSMQIVEKVFEQIKRRLGRQRSRSLPTERELAEFIRFVGFKLDAEDVSFPPIVASGTNAVVPHHIASHKRLKPGESIIIDFGFKYKNYCSDFTRTVFLKRVPLQLEKAYNQVEKAYNQSIDFIERSLSPLGTGNAPAAKKVEVANSRPLKAGDVYRKAVDVLAETQLDKYFIHSLGHGTGLEIHELPNLSPKSKDILKNNMVFSLEPAVYIPKLGGIRIEDLVYLDSGKIKKFINVSTKLERNII